MKLIKIESLTRPNLWSYLSLRGSEEYLCRAKAEEKGKIEREIQEQIVKKAILTNFLKARINSKLNEIKNALLLHYEVREVEIRALSKVLVGVSESFGKIIFEVGLHFDFIMNVPYIPGSTIKGAVSSAAFDLLYEETLKKELEKEKDMEKAQKKAKEYAESECRRLFGGLWREEQSIGLIGFSDAYPIESGENGFILYPDVMTPHYTEYISTELDVMPIPIVHLTIAPGTKFKFYVFYKRKKGKRELSISDFVDSPTPDKLGLVDKSLLYAFIRGVGARTSLGYSKFEITDYRKVSE